ncbi:hypothetical protein BN1708_015502 [Verticillium longisporum]|uniref:Uncharacterized protein n=1 Tax=Verticillium longisporum TaxID=100787 RepID=A0A0G4M4F8_VERLO|nr:hypothetical protein BN1708_015502 [Verticillium longisporum]
MVQTCAISPGSGCDSLNDRLHLVRDAILKCNHLFKGGLKIPRQSQGDLHDRVPPLGQDGVDVVLPKRRNVQTNANEDDSELYELSGCRREVW